MPEYYLLPKGLARRLPKLAAFAQWVESTLFRGVFWLIRRMSLESANRLAGFLFGTLGPYGAKVEKARENLAVAFPQSSEQWRRDTAREIYRHVGYSAVELAKLDQIWEQRDQRLEFVVHPRAHEHLAAKRPAVFVSAHVGPWQVASLLAQHYGFPCSVIYAPESNAIMREVMAQLRSTFGVGWISSAEGLRPLIRELQAGHCIGMAMDTRLDTGKLVPFFGRDALTNTSAAGITLRTGAALIPLRGERLPGSRFRITVYDPLQSELPEADPRDQALELTAQVNRYFEEWIRETPGQWICLKRRWPKAHKL